MSAPEIKTLISALNALAHETLKSSNEEQLRKFHALTDHWRQLAAAEIDKRR